MDEYFLTREGHILLLLAITALLLVAETYVLWAYGVFNRTGRHWLLWIAWAAFYLFVMLPLNAVIALVISIKLG